MTLAWELSIPATPKMVLLSLADQANDDGKCWPGQPLIAKRCSITERAVRDQITWLEREGFIRREVKAGIGTLYTLVISKPDQPRNNLPPRKEVPPRIVVPATPEQSAGHPGTSFRQTVSEPSITVKPSPRERKTSIPADWVLPDEYKSWALEERKDWTPEHCLLVAASFADHWRGKGEARADWLATWRNWVRRESKFQRTPQASRIPAPDNFAGRQYGQGGLI